jgi:hypothetical protein
MKAILIFILLVLSPGVLGDSYQYYEPESGVRIDGLEWASSIDSRGLSSGLKVFRINSSETRFFVTGAIVSESKNLSPMQIVQRFINGAKGNYPDIEMVSSKEITGRFYDKNRIGILAFSHFSGNSMKLCDTYAAYSISNGRYFVVTVNSPEYECVDNPDYLSGKISDIVSKTSIYKSNKSIQPTAEASAD